MAENNIDVKKMPFERAIEELESIVKRLEGRFAEDPSPFMSAARH
jgi:exonuclease VII small subunit